MTDQGLATAAASQYISDVKFVQFLEHGGDDHMARAG